MNHFYSKFCFSLTAFCFLISFNLKAQDTTYTPARLKAAQEMLNATDQKSRFQTSMNTSIKLQELKLPEDKRAGFEEVMHQFLNKYLTWDIISEKMCKLYAAEFTTEELQQLAAFYKTPVGKKFGSKQTEIFFKAEQIGQQIALAHKDELKTMFEAAYSKK
ncbi:DUF2059 domain-containing protein [Mucilaginibacter arboris]|uniref:DUF2059 domain-containing protein n=1 Tax=Mucilaginibacter arboris TaxID=2682090 RepID=A0A7K1SZX2_9SPHI|nr:DUF2059 domain-containing protein [Mucilaginibacter arboris]MVN22853.1 DUF2059 domain-containing protein [Mucilaginibacter arboris]